VGLDWVIQKYDLIMLVIYARFMGFVLSAFSLSGGSKSNLPEEIEFNLIILWNTDINYEIMLNSIQKSAKITAQLSFNL